MQRAAHQLLLDGPEHAAVPRVAVRRLSGAVSASYWLAELTFALARMTLNLSVATTRPPTSRDLLFAEL